MAVSPVTSASCRTGASLVTSIDSYGVTLTTTCTGPRLDALTSTSLATPRPRASTMWEACEATALLVTVMLPPSMSMTMIALSLRENSERPSSKTSHAAVMARHTSTAPM